MQRIDEFCEQKRLVSLTLADQERVLPCRFSGFESDSVTLEVLSPGTEELTGLPLPCTLIFTDGNETNLLFGSAKSFTRDPGSFPKIRLRVADRISKTETRTSFRVPLSPTSKLQVTLRSEEKEWTPRPVDISLGGILLDFSAVEVPDLWDCEDLTIKLTIDDQSVELDGFPGRRDDSCYAVYFSEALRSLRRAPTEIPRVLGGIIEKLEQEWLEQQSL